MDYNDEALIRRIHREVADYYDEELELELEDRDPALIQSLLARESGGPGDNSGVTDSEDERAERHMYFRELFRLQGELVKLQSWVVATGHKVVILFEGRDAAGSAATRHTQWYFQRYVSHLPAAGEMVLFDRSWDNRAGVERVMGFCTDDQYEEFFRSVPEFERMLVRSGIQVIKYWFSISDEEQHLRFLSRIHDPLKQWKLSPMDLESRRRWEDYTRAKEIMLERTHIPEAPWWIVQAVDKKRARLNCIRHLLGQMPYVEPSQPVIVLPERERHADYTRQPVPDSMIVPEVY